MVNFKKLNKLNEKENPDEYAVKERSVAEVTKEYTAISTRQKNSFINTRNYAGSDFTMSWVEDSDLDCSTYHDAWHKSMDLIRDGEIIIDYQMTKDKYTVDIPYSNSVYVLLFDQGSYNLRGIFLLLGVMPINFNTKNLIGDRGSPKISTQNIQYKFMDFHYKFYKNWEEFNKDVNTKNTLAWNFNNGVLVNKTNKKLTGQKKNK